jgi:hypothetical protein
MTEVEWLACEDPTPMLEFLRGKVSDRRLYLLSIACIRFFSQPTSEDTTFTLELFEADADFDNPQLQIAIDSEYVQSDLGFVGNPFRLAENATRQMHQFGERERTQFMRDIFGNPFHPIVFDPSWLTSTVVAVAQQMYESRDFSAMPILADALQDAGCSNEAILDHCRGSGPHVRGCWVVDGCLSRE